MPPKLIPDETLNKILFVKSSSLCKVLIDIPCCTGKVKRLEGSEAIASLFLPCLPYAIMNALRLYLWLVWVHLLRAQDYSIPNQWIVRIVYFHGGTMSLIRRSHRTLHLLSAEMKGSSWPRGCTAPSIQATTWIVGWFSVGAYIYCVIIGESLTVVRSWIWPECKFAFRHDHLWFNSARQRNEQLQCDNGSTQQSYSWDYSGVGDTMFYVFNLMRLIWLCIIQARCMFYSCPIYIDHVLIWSLCSLSAMIQCKHSHSETSSCGISNQTPIRMWGLTAIYAYRAYQQRPFLALATQIWEAYTPWVINEADAANGSHPLKNVTFQSECNGSELEHSLTSTMGRTNKCTASVAGGVFWVSLGLRDHIPSYNRPFPLKNIDEPSSTGIIAGGEGYVYVLFQSNNISDNLCYRAYMAYYCSVPSWDAFSDLCACRLSAYLYDITDNQTYYDATVMTYTFIDSHIFNEAKGYVMDSFLVQTCVGDDPLVMTYNTGLYLEALSLFANKTANTTLVQKWVYSPCAHMPCLLAVGVEQINSLWVPSNRQNGRQAMGSW